MNSTLLINSWENCEFSDSFIKIFCLTHLNFVMVVNSFVWMRRKETTNWINCILLAHLSLQWDYNKGKWPLATFIKLIILTLSVEIFPFLFHYVWHYFQCAEANSEHEFCCFAERSKIQINNYYNGDILSFSLQSWA